MDEISFAIRAPLARADLPGLFARVCRMLETARPRTISCAVTGIAADAVALDALARLQLAARRHGTALEFVGASAELCELLAFCGLDWAIRTAGAEADRTAGRADRWRGRR